MKEKAGFRTIGPKKMKILLKIFETTNKLSSKGINSKKVLEYIPEWKGAMRTPRKKLYGIQNKLTQLLKIA